MVVDQDIAYPALVAEWSAGATHGLQSLILQNLPWPLLPFYRLIHGKNSWTVAPIVRVIWAWLAVWLPSGR
jgi:hypothetical protein